MLKKLYTIHEIIKSLLLNFILNIFMINYKSILYIMSPQFFATL